MHGLPGTGMQALQRIESRIDALLQTCVLTAEEEAPKNEIPTYQEIEAALPRTIQMYLKEIKSKRWWTIDPKHWDGIRCDVYPQGEIVVNLDLEYKVSYLQAGIIQRGNIGKSADAKNEFWTRVTQFLDPPPTHPEGLPFDQERYDRIVEVLQSRMTPYCSGEWYGAPTRDGIHYRHYDDNPRQHIINNYKEIRVDKDLTYSIYRAYGNKRWRGNLRLDGLNVDSFFKTVQYMCIQTVREAPKT
jgi:hypothetical protein